jgi:dTMP kinase
MFFSFDGVDGTGKSTQLSLFCDWLRSVGCDVVTCRDPGGTALGEQIRSILLDSQDTPIHRRSEMLLYQASRAQLVEEVIRPALAAGKTVVCDRFLLATVVYQGHAGGLGAENVKHVGQVATGGIGPDLTFVLDMPAAKAAARIEREMDRMERQGLVYLQHVRRGYLAEAEKDPEHVVVIDADRSIDEVRQDIRGIAERVLGGR